MKSRIPLIVAVVGALLVGGATTGTTRASWTDQRSLAGSSVTAGQMKLDVPTTAALSNELDPASTPTGTASFTITDESTGKNLVHEITAQVTGETTGLDAKIGATCAVATAESVAITKTPHDSDRTFTPCVKVTSSTGAVTGDVTITVIADQVGGGWTSVSHHVTIPVEVRGFGLRCEDSSANNTVRLVWDSLGSGVQYTYGFHATSSLGPFGNGQTVGSTSIDQTWSNHDFRYYRVTANTSPIQTTAVIKVDRLNAADFECTVVPE